MARPDLNDLKGFTVAITADRRRDEQAVLMERLGVEVIMFPLLQTRPEDATVLRGLSEKLVQQPPDYLVANTGYGMRTWLASTAEWGLQDGLVSALGSRTAIAARGAKALGELRKAGLDAWYKAPGETLEEVVARLRVEDLVGRSVVVQLHGEAPGPALAELEDAGAEVSYLPVYRMSEGAAEAAGAFSQRAPGRRCRRGDVHGRASGTGPGRCRWRPWSPRPGPGRVQQRRGYRRLHRTGVRRRRCQRRHIETVST